MIQQQCEPLVEAILFDVEPKLHLAFVCTSLNSRSVQVGEQRYDLAMADVATDIIL